MSRFNDQYRNDSYRQKNWDYRTAGEYFVTITTLGRIHFFGQIEQGIMKLNELGAYADQCINKINRYNKYASISAHIVMPDHVHAIIHLQNSFSYYQPPRFGPLQIGSLSSVVNHFKGRVTKFSRIAVPQQIIWQDLYYDHRIRNLEEYIRIKEYIRQNPIKWGKGKNPLNPNRD